MFFCVWVSGSILNLNDNRHSIQSDSENARFSFNFLEYIPKEHFDFNVDFTFVFLNSNRLVEIHPEAFSKLKKLAGIDLSDNQLSEIPESLFETNTELQTIK